MNNLRGVQYLTKQYQTGPVENKSGQKLPYLQYLNTDLNSASTRLTDLISQQNQKYEDWVRNNRTALICAAGSWLTSSLHNQKTATGIAVGTAFCGPIGWVVMSFKASEASDLRDAYENLMSQVEKLKNDNQEQLDLITCVTQLVNQFDNIDDKMITAIDAMTELSQLFNEQATCYDKIALYLGGMKTGADAKGLANRKAFIDYNLKQAIKKLKEVCDPLLPVFFCRQNSMLTKWYFTFSAERSSP